MSPLVARHGDRPGDGHAAAHDSTIPRKLIVQLLFAAEDANLSLLLDLILIYLLMPGRAEGL